MNARKSLTTAAIASVAFFSLFGAQAAHAAPGGNGNGNGQIGSIGIGPAPVDLHNDEAETKNDCPSDDAWWHFVLAPNNGQYAFTSMNLNIGGSATLISGADIVANGGQTDNVFVAGPEGASLDDLIAAGSSAMVDPHSTSVKFVLSHVCEGDEVIVEEPVAEEEVTEDEVTVADEPAVEDDAPVSDDENSEEETAEEDGADDPIKDTNNDTNDNEQDNPITEIVTPDPEEQDLDETPTMSPTTLRSTRMTASSKLHPSSKPLPTLKLLLRSTSLLTTPITTPCQPPEWNSPLHSLAWDSPALGERSSPCAVA